MAKKLQSLIDEYNEKVQGSTPAQIAKMTEAIKEARAKEQAALAAGVEPCKVCGNLPHVIKQPRTAGNMILYYYEVGCLTDARAHAALKGEDSPEKPCRVMGQEREAAVTEWNKLYA